MFEEMCECPPSSLASPPCSPTASPARCLFEEVCEWPFLETTMAATAAPPGTPGASSSGVPAVTPPSDYAGLLKDSKCGPVCGVELGVWRILVCC